MKVLGRTDKMGYALAPKELVNRRLKVRFMYREQPDNDQDSGWRFFSGYETDEYVNDPDNIGLYDVSTISQIDGDIVKYLDSPPGSAFERERERQPFVKAEGFFQ